MTRRKDALFHVINDDNPRLLVSFNFRLIPFMAIYFYSGK